MAVGTVSLNKLKARGDKRDAGHAADTDLSSGYHRGRIYSAISQQHALTRLLKCVSFVLSSCASVTFVSRRPSVCPFVSVRLPLCLLGSGHQNIFTVCMRCLCVSRLWFHVLLVFLCPCGCLFLLFCLL